MAVAESCDVHVWTSLGVTARDGEISRVWECEQCSAWTVESLEPKSEIPWEETWLAEQ